MGTISSLATYVNHGPNFTKRTGRVIDTLTPHVVVGMWTSKFGADYFADRNRAGKSSPTYFIGFSGDIASCVDEENEPWTTGAKNPIYVLGQSGRANDGRAITFEIASDTKHPYKITDASYNAMISLMVDICRRYGKKKLLFLGTPETTLTYKIKEDEMVLSAHRWYAPKACPGDYLYERYPEIAETVTKLLNEEEEDEMAVVYTTFDQVPVWYKPSVEKAMNKQSVGGDGMVLRGTAIEDGKVQINLTESEARMLTMLDRLGIL